MDVTETIVCFPGDRICATNENTIAGAGTYERLGYIYASLAGIVETKTQEKVSDKTCESSWIVDLFIAERSHQSHNNRKQNCSSSSRRCCDGKSWSCQSAFCEMLDHLHWRYFTEPTSPWDPSKRRCASDRHRSSWDVQELPPQRCHPRESDSSNRDPHLQFDYSWERTRRRYCFSSRTCNVIKHFRACSNGPRLMERDAVSSNSDQGTEKSRENYVGKYFSCTTINRTFL